jgi:hypothetical protein
MTTKTRTADFALPDAAHLTDGPSCEQVVAVIPVAGDRYYVEGEIERRLEGSVRPSREVLAVLCLADGTLRTVTGAYNQAPRIEPAGTKWDGLSMDAE